MDEVAGHHAGDVGPELEEQPPATAPQTDAMPPNTEPTRKRIESQ
jgi:hypothetical protein